MEAKRSSVQTLQAKAPISKTQMIKTASDVSLSPSQAAERAKLNASRKNPLDALSRLSIRQQIVEKRSGLQDVDEEYLKSNVFSNQRFPRNSGLTDVYGTKNQMTNNQISVTRLAAGQQQQQQQQPPLAQTESSYKLKTSADGGAGESPLQAQVQQAQAHTQQMQAQNRNQNQMKEPNASPRPNPASIPISNEPEMCTTCPNCNTTIYLVRGPETMPDNAAMPAAGMPSGHHHQQQQQQYQQQHNYHHQQQQQQQPPQQQNQQQHQVGDHSHNAASSAPITN